MDRKVILEAARLGFLKQIDDLRARVAYVDQELAGKPIPKDIAEVCYPAKSPKGRLLGKLAAMHVVDGPEGRLHRTCLSCGVRLKYHWPAAITKPVRYQGEGVDIDALRELNRL